MPEIKRVTLHPLKSDGSIDTDVNLYPKTLIDGIVDREGDPIDIPSLIDQETERAESVEQELDSKINDEQTRAQTAETSLNTTIHQEVEERQLADTNLSNRIDQITINYYTKSETDNLLLQKEDLENKVNVISNESTDTEYPSALAVKDYVENKLDHKNPVNEVNSLLDVPDNKLGLYKYTETVPDTEISRSSHIVEVSKEDHPASETEFFKTTSSNNQDAASADKFMNQFDSSLSHFVTVLEQHVETSEEYPRNLFTLNYAPIEGGSIDEVVSGIRFGTAQQEGVLVIVLNQPGTLYFRQYFSYNASTGAIIAYDENTSINVFNDTTGEDYGIACDRDEWNYTYAIPVSAGTIFIRQSNGRAIFMGFSFDAEPYSIYDKHELARVEEVTEVQTQLDTHIATSNARFNTDENAIQRNASDIIAINDKIGPIQCYQVYNNLPTASEAFLDKVFRLDETFYQCVKQGDGEHKEWAYNVTGTSAITAETYEAFVNEIGREYKDYITSITTTPGEEGAEDEVILNAEKIYRNNGTLKLGSSSSVGSIRLENCYELGLPITSFKIGVRAYNYGTTKTTPSAVYIEDTSGDEPIRVLLDPTVEETVIEIPYVDDDNLNSVYIESMPTYEDGEGAIITCDKRAIITRIIVDFGTTEYVWKAINGGSSETMSYEETMDILQGE